MDSPSSSERFSYNPKLHWNPQLLQYFNAAYGADHFARISHALTHPSSYSCIRVNTLKSTSDAVIEKLTSLLTDINHHGVSSKNAEAVNEENLADTVVDDKTSISKYVNNGNFHGTGSSDLIICKCPYPGLPNVVFVKGTGPHTPQYNCDLAGPMKEVIVSRKCAEAVLRGAQIYVPGVLACSAHVEKGDLVTVSVAVEQPAADGGWGVGITRGTVLQGLQSDPHYHERSGLFIGQGITSLSRAKMFRVTEGVAVEMTDKIYKLPSFNDVLEGEIFLQNLPSIVTAYVLDPQEGERILDMCAAPGGKTTAIAILMRDKGKVIAIDRSHNKVMDILKLASEMGLTCIETYKLDALKSVCRSDIQISSNLKTETEDVSAADPAKSLVDLKLSESLQALGTNGTDLPNADGAEECKRYLSKADLRKKARQMRNGPGRNQCMGGRVEKSKGFLPNSFDRVLLDAPCSALGLRPRLFAGEETIESLMNHGKYQRRMFDQAVQLVRPGGVIVYSTCTINPGENEALVRYALDTYKFLTLLPQNPRIGGPGITGRCNILDGKCVEEWLTEDEAKLVQRFDPSSSLDTIGFFIAKFSVGLKD